MILAVRATANNYNKEQYRNISWQKCLQPGIEMIKKHLTWITFTVACSIAAMVSMKALASDGQPIVGVVDFVKRNAFTDQFSGAHT